MKRVFIFLPLMMSSFLVNCNSTKLGTFKFSFIGTNCTINSHEEFHDDVIKNKKNIEYTIVPADGCLLPISLSEQPSGVTYNKDNGVIAITKMSSDLTIKATANPDESHHIVNFDTFGAGDIHNQIVEDMDVAFEPVAPEKPGFNFKGWYVNDDFTGNPYDFTTPVTTNITLYANYVKKTFVVTFYDEDGTTIVDQQNEVLWGSKPSSKVIPHKDDTSEYNYEFDKWEPEITDDTLVTSDMDFKATYKKTKRKYKVTWIKYDSEIYKEETVEYGLTPTPPETDPTRDETNRIKYTFTGWDKNIETVKGDQVYTAKWKETKKYEIRFINYDSTPIGDVQYVAENTKPNVPEPPTREPDEKYTYTFKDWGVDTVPAASKDVIYQARFTKSINKFAVSFVLGEKGIMYEPDQQQVLYGYNASKPKRDPYRPGYRFLGWYNEETTELFDFNSLITKATTVVAKWEKDDSFSEPFYVENAYDGNNSMVVPNNWKYKLSLNNPWLDGDGSSITFSDKLYLGRDSTDEFKQEINPSQKFNVGGNIMSLLNSDSDVFQTANTIEVSFETLFHRGYVYRLYDASKLLLPATELSSSCYLQMFAYAENMIKTPILLPAKILSNLCYYSMFTGCKSIINAPILAFTQTKSNSCYAMFQSSSISFVPDISSASLSSNCYSYMFNNCASLVNISSLPATNLFESCYANMFSSCVSLKHVPLLPATVLVNNCYGEMFYKCSSLEITDNEDNNIKVFTCNAKGSDVAKDMFSMTKGHESLTPSNGKTYYYILQQVAEGAI